MKRRHLRHDALEFCQKARSYRPEVIFGADLIAGFPTETEEMFQNTLRIIDECDLTFLHVFPYSPRPGTPASRMPQVAPSLIKERAARLRHLGEQKIQQVFDRMMGNVVEIMVEALEEKGQ